LAYSAHIPNGRRLDILNFFLWNPGDDDDSEDDEEEGDVDDDDEAEDEDDDGEEDDDDEDFDDFDDSMALSGLQRCVKGERRAPVDERKKQVGRDLALLWPLFPSIFKETPLRLPMI
jgi:TATA-binding protein-associated factor Taf7